MEGSSLLVSRGAKPWQGRTLEGSGSSGARFWTPAVLRGRVVTRALAVAARAFGPLRFCVEGSSLLVSRVAKPWRGRALEGSGGSGAHFWTPAVLRGRVVTFGLERRETVAGASFRGLWR